ncbi:MAG: electron transport complex subunit E [Erysipelotrichales bacterium]|nr:electron transport complex subunit E [Erysipelotrichales bacterium]
MTNKENFLKGFIKENSLFVMMLGLCPALATTRSIEAAIGMGLLITFVLICSNTLISALRTVIADEVRIPAYIVIIATFVTIVRILTETFLPDLSASLGVFIPLIAVNCIIFGRAEAFASKNKIFPSLIDGLSIGLGTLLALVVVGFFRELLGTGAIAYGHYFPLGVQGAIRIIPSDYAISVFVMAPGAFLILGVLIAVFVKIQDRKGEAK